MSFFDEALTGETLEAIKAKVIAYAAGAELAITDWISGGTGEQLFQAFSLSLHSATQVVARVTRGFASLDTSTDPGDVDDFDAGNEDLEAASGFLSAYGANTYGTPRGGATFASGFYTFTNAGPGARTFAPDTLTFTWTVSPPGDGLPAPTYRNGADDTIYTNPDGTVTVAAGTSLEIPIVAEEIGSRSSAPASAITLTTTLTGVTGTNADAVTGTDREDATVYRARCRQAPARVSLGGPADAYAYLAAKNLDGTPLLNASGNATGITRVQVSQDSATGVVNVAYGSADGEPIGEDVTAANTNIEAEAFAVPDAITFTGAAATEVSIHVVGSGKIRARAGVTEAAVKAAIVAALEDAFAEFPIGGVDQDGAGAGVIYTTDLQAVAARAYPGLYDVLVTTPAGATTALTFGQVATPNTVAGDWTVTIV